jgi:hypothetical protein
LCLFVGIAILTIPTQTFACSCAWKGPFLTASQDAPLVVIGKILRHHPGQSPTMDVLILETLKGGILDSGIVVQMGDGMHCRPTMDLFPPESKWILALNGHGGKPGAGLAVSHCGEYWLQLDKDDVVGSIDGDSKQIKRMPLQELKNRFLYPRFSINFKGRIEAGKKFHRPFGSRFEFILEPNQAGWDIVISEYGREENLARLTPPLHFMPNPREIEGWHLLDNPSACPTRPYQAEAGPANPRIFIFSPEVGRQIDGINANRSITPGEIETIENFGRGTLSINKFKLSSGKDGCPKIEWFEFSVQIKGGY